MYENKCAICGQSIIGYWHEIGKNHICQSCAASITVYDLYMRDIIDIKPDIVDTNATLVTNEDAMNLIKIGRKAAVAVAAKIEKGEMEGDPLEDTNATLVTKANEQADALENEADMSDEQVEKFFTSQEPVFNAGES